MRNIGGSLTVVGDVATTNIAASGILSVSEQCKSLVEV
jgi:hypothetical protein